jgi:hypothetical protein
MEWSLKCPFLCALPRYGSGTNLWRSEPMERYWDERVRLPPMVNIVLALTP